MLVPVRILVAHTPVEAHTAAAEERIAAAEARTVAVGARTAVVGVRTAVVVHMGAVRMQVVVRLAIVGASCTSWHLRQSISLF